MDTTKRYIKMEKEFEIDYLGLMTQSDINAPGSGFTKHQKGNIDGLEVGEKIELADLNIIFNVKRIK